MMKKLQWFLTGVLIAFAAPWVAAQTPTFFPNLRVGTTLQVPAAAPASPLDGQLWTTTSGLFARINGSTIGPYVATSTSPGGVDTQVQFNDGGAFGGDAGLVYNKTTDALTIAGLTTSGTLTSNGLTNTVGLTSTGLVLTPASASGGSGLRLPHGAAPSAPTNGDLWTTTTGLFARINGSTVGPFIGSSGIAFPLLAPANQTVPQYTFTGDTSVGIFESSAGVMSLSTGSGNLITLSNATLALGIGSGPIQLNATQLRNGDGSVGTPTYSFDNDRTTGLYRVGASDIGFSVAGSKIVDFLTTGVTVAGAISAGTNGLTGGTLTISNAGGDTIRLSDTTQGADAKHTLVRTGTGGRYLVQTATDATPTTPSKNIFEATRTGAAVATVALGNSTDNPTFSVNAIDMTPQTGTFTVNFDAACTTTPSVTFNYYVTGPQVTIAPASTSGFTCTGDVNTFSTTAADVPAILRPSSTAVQSSPITGVALDNGAAATVEFLINSTGTMNLMNCTTVTSCLTNTWTASGNRQFAISSLRPQFTYYKH